jgi:hypothetical protein
VTRGLTVGQFGFWWYPADKSPKYYLCQSTVHEKNFEPSNSRFRGKNPCLARHAAQGELGSPRCGIFLLQAVPFFEKILAI